MLKRNIKVMFRVNEKEFEQLQNRAKRCGYTREHYIRTVLSGHIPKESPPIEFWKVINELNAIGNSLNQIAARANAMGFFTRIPLNSGISKGAMSQSYDSDGFLAEEYKENTEKLFCTILEIERVICLPEKIDLNIRTQKKKER